jgi:hypothetical protein
MKKFILHLSLFSFGAIVLLSACAKTDPEPSPTDARSKFTGQWNVTETKKKLSYQVNITADASSSSEVHIDNFGDFGARASASVSGNTITLRSNQTLGTVLVISGGGTYSSSSNTIVWSYTYTDQADQQTVSAIYSR